MDFAEAPALVWVFVLLLPSIPQYARIQVPLVFRPLTSRVARRVRAARVYSWFSVLLLYMV